jgi:hypothetical protein
MTKRAFIVAILSFMCLTSFGRKDSGTIHVKVLDAETDQPIPFADVDLNQTTLDAHTNDRGELDVKKIPFGTYLLVISEIGHISQQRKLIIRGQRKRRP